MYVLKMKMTARVLKFVNVYECIYRRVFEIIAWIENLEGCATRGAM